MKTHKLGRELKAADGHYSQRTAFPVAVMTQIIRSSSGTLYKKLARERYRGFTFVHWVLCIDQHATGWLTDTLPAVA
jgi:hypothetical protein